MVIGALGLPGLLVTMVDKGQEDALVTTQHLQVEELHVLVHLYNQSNVRVMEAGVVVHQLINVMLIKETVILMLIVKLASNAVQTIVNHQQLTIITATLIVVTNHQVKN